MKHIVLYTMISMTGLLLFCTETAGQKTTIGLLPSAHQRIHPEASIDTSFSNDTLNRIVQKEQPSSIYIYGKERKSIYRKESRRIGFQLDSLFQKTDSKGNSHVKRSGNSLLILKYFNPIKFIMHITALKI